MEIDQSPSLIQPLTPALATSSPIVVPSGTPPVVTPAAVVTPQPATTPTSTSRPAVSPAAAPVEGITLSRLEELFSEARATEKWTAVIRTIGQVFSSEDVLNRSFLSESDSVFAGLNLDDVRKAFELLSSVPEVGGVLNSLTFATNSLLLNLETKANFMSQPSDLRVFMILLLNPLMYDPQHHSIFIKLCLSVKHLNERGTQVLQTWLQNFTRDMFDTLLATIQTFIAIRIESSPSLVMHEDPPIVSAVILLKLLFEANLVVRYVPMSDFYNDSLNENVDLRRDFIQWFERHSHDGLPAGGEHFFSFTDHSFVLDPASKSEILHYDAQIQQHRRAREALVQSALENEPRAFPYLVLEVRREHLLRDTLTHLIYRDVMDLKKELKVVFAGEEGIDQGGVKKEFFQILLRDLLDPKYGMFRYQEETRQLWFNSDSMDSPAEYRLIGILLGLAIYNGVILDVRFPSVVYKKLSGIEPTLSDLIEASPQLGKGLQQLLRHEGAVEDLCQTFQLTYEVYGEVRTFDLIPNGGDVLVTNANRQQYVDLYVKYMLVDCVAPQFNAFAQGFHDVCGGLAIKLFRPEELELLICGNPTLDFAALELGTEYDNGYDAQHQLIRWFWKIVHDLDEAKKKRLLFFCTGSDRAPIKGLQSMHLVVARNGPDSDRLPTAHTCFNHLLLPEYDSEEKLKRMLLTAIENAEGFGLK
eukprot:TRINITY_DN6441_c0_g2_i1.p1 TRINITY_DN6441_c0_g2~~TRINITY_DN6441_c0_g2_i1.p1  ORF type:complete len:795 (-),score=168.03 TRINITY_DN6441_c0_g2_i1:796-2895(-)